MITKLVPNSDTIHFETPETFTINAQSGDLYMHGEILKFSPTEVKTNFSGKYKQPYGTFQFVSHDNEGFNVLLKPKLPYQFGPIKIIAGFRSKAVLDYEYKLENTNTPVFTTKSSVSIQLPGIKSFKWRTENIFRYKISSLRSYLYGTTDSLNVELSAHINIKQFAAAFITNVQEQKYGVVGSAVINKYPLAFQLANGPQGIDFRIGAKIQGEENKLLMYLQNISTLCAKTELHLSKPVTFTAWMSTPITNTELAKYGFDIHIDYSKIE